MPTKKIAGHSQAGKGNEAIEVLYARSKTIKPLDICPLPAPQSIQKFYCEKVSVK